MKSIKPKIRKKSSDIIQQVLDSVKDQLVSDEDKLPKSITTQQEKDSAARAVAETQRQSIPKYPFYIGVPWDYGWAIVKGDYDSTFPHKIICLFRSKIRKSPDNFYISCKDKLKKYEMKNKNAFSIVVLHSATPELLKAIKLFYSRKD